MNYHLNHYHLNLTYLLTHNGLLHAFAHIPLETKTLNLSSNELGKKSVEVLTTLLAAIPKQVETLVLAHNSLGYKTTAELATVFAAIPKHVKSLDLSFNYLGNYTAAELAAVFAAIPPHVETLNLYGNFLVEKNVEELKTTFAAIPPQVKNLNLRKNHLYKKEELRYAFSSLPKSITTLDLSHSNLHLDSLPQLLTLLQALPDSITYIDLSYNHLLTSRSLQQRDEFLQALGSLRENGRLNFNLAHNGESEGARAFLPLKTLAHKHALPDLVREHILSFLTPMPESKISKNRQKWDDKLAKQRDVKLAQQNLLACVKTLITQDSFWENKVRFPNQTTRKRPQGIQQIEFLLKDFEGNPAQCCQEIIACSSARHSKHWQWAHHFFRGRDNTTNTIYGILKEVVINDTQSIEAAIKSLNNLQAEHRVNDSANTSGKGSSLN